MNSHASFLCVRAGEDREVVAAVEGHGLAARAGGQRCHAPVSRRSAHRSHVVDALDHALQQHGVQGEGDLALGGERAEIAHLLPGLQIAALRERAHPGEIGGHFRRGRALAAIGQRIGAERRHPRPVRRHGEDAVGGVDADPGDVRLRLLDRGEIRHQLVDRARAACWDRARPSASPPCCTRARPAPPSMASAMSLPPGMSPFSDCGVKASVPPAPRYAFERLELAGEREQDGVVALQLRDVRRIARTHAQHELVRDLAEGDGLAFDVDGGVQSSRTRRSPPGCPAAWPPRHPPSWRRSASPSPARAGWRASWRRPALRPAMTA